MDSPGGPDFVSYEAGLMNNRVEFTMNMAKDPAAAKKAVANARAAASSTAKNLAGATCGGKECECACDVEVVNIIEQWSKDSKGIHVTFTFVMECSGTCQKHG